jgi:cob(I)alamin adenosyltransferase
MTRIYTRTGDDGTTGLIGGRRVPKDDPRIDAVGTVDELNAALAPVRVELGRSETVPEDLETLLDTVQHRLFDIGAELATPSPATPSGAIEEIQVRQLEEAIDRYDSQLAPLREFILPGGAPLAAQLHLARAVCRRAERQVVALAGIDQVRPEVIRYLNRLSDLLFVAARATNAAAGVADVKWRKA